MEKRNTIKCEQCVWWLKTMQNVFFFFDRNKIFLKVVLFNILCDLYSLF